jgi:hypothetical protein
MSNYILDAETDIETQGSWSETDDETEINELLYEPEEPSLTKYNIVLCELYNKEYHGHVDGVINNHYLTLVRFRKYDYNYINSFIMDNPSRFRLEIAECLYLPSSHCVSILKMHWLKLIQRKWKKIYKDMKLIKLIRSHPNSLKYREIHGNWPNNCSKYPTLRGMLSNLPNTSTSSGNFS